MNVLDEIVKDQIRTDIPTLAPGDTVKVSAKVVEGNRERVQVFEGTILRLTGGGITRSLTASLRGPHKLGSLSPWPNARVSIRAS